MTLTRPLSVEPVPLTRAKVVAESVAPSKVADKVPTTAPAMLVSLSTPCAKVVIMFVAAVVTVKSPALVAVAFANTTVGAET